MISITYGDFTPDFEEIWMEGSLPYSRFGETAAHSRRSPAIAIADLWGAAVSRGGKGVRSDLNTGK